MTNPDTDAHDVLDRAGQLLRTPFGVEHATLQVEPDTHTGCKAMAW